MWVVLIFFEEVKVIIFFFLIESEVLFLEFLLWGLIRLVNCVCSFGLSILVVIVWECDDDFIML